MYIYIYIYIYVYTYGQDKPRLAHGGGMEVPDGGDDRGELWVSNFNLMGNIVPSMSSPS